MFIFLIYTSAILSLLLILFILSQPSKQQDVLSILSSDKSSILFQTQKYQGSDIFLQWMTAILAIVWIIICITLIY